MPKPLQDLSILVVEDEFWLALDLERIVQEAGASQTNIAPSLGDANRLLSSIWFDVAILDIRLMDGNSLPLAQTLIARGASVVIHSGHIEHSHRQDAPQAVFLPKPAKPTEIVQSVLFASGIADSFQLPGQQLAPSGVALH